MHEETRIEPTDHEQIMALRPWTHRRRASPSAARTPTAARFELSSTSLPPLALALPVGDRIRMALSCWSEGHVTFRRRELTAHVERGAGSAWFLAGDDDGDGIIDHLVVYARSGFDRAALRALEHLRRVWGHGGPDLKLALVGLGSPDELGCLRRHAPCAVLSPQLGTARVWESSTAFVPPRPARHHAAPHDQVLRLLALQGLPPAIVEPLAPAQPPIDWDLFQRFRAPGGGHRGAGAAFGFRLRFERPVAGPIALGYAARQGLGQFVAIE